VKTAKINFEIFPVGPGQFAILDLESQKREISYRRRAPSGAPSLFGKE
jgi:hypothetical protein